MDNIKAFMKKWPAGYRRLRNVWYGFRRILETYIFGTKMQEWLWRSKFRFGSTGWRKSFDGALSHPHRMMLIERISVYAPFESILEIGCNRGQNLLLLSKKFPDIKLCGLDINTVAISEGKKQMEQRCIKNVELSSGKADDLSRYADKSIDIVFTDALCIYICPDEIVKFISEAVRIARKVVIFSEWHGEDIGAVHLYLGGKWIYDYKNMLGRFPYKTIISKFHGGEWNDEGWNRYGAIIEVRFEK